MTIITGYIAKAAETKLVDGVGTVTNFTVAKNYINRKGEKVAKFIKCSGWNDKYSKIAKYLYTGRVVEIQGELDAEAYMDKSGKPAAQLVMKSPFIQLFGSATKPETDVVVETVVESGDPDDTPFA
jgi:single-stranded DNA-binding protein